MKYRLQFTRKNKIIILASLITLVAIVVILLFHFRRTEKSLPDIPLPGVTGEWADSVYHTLTPAAKIELLLLTPYDPSIKEHVKVLDSFTTGGTLLRPDSLKFFREFFSKSRKLSSPAIHWLSSPDSIPDYPLPFTIDQLMSVSDDSLLFQYLDHQLSIMHATGSTIAHYPLWKSLPHSPELPDTFYLQRQARLFKEFCRRSFETGIIPGIAVPDFLQQHRRLNTAHDSLILSHFRKLIDSTAPILMSKSAPTPRGATTLRQSLKGRFGFRGLLVLEEPVSGQNHFFQNLEQGFDMQVCATSPTTLVQRAAEQYLRDKHARKLVDAAVMRVLLYREWIRSNHGDHSPEILQSHTLRKLILELTNGSLVLLNNHNDVVPLKATDPVCVHVPVGLNFSHFASIIDLFAPAEVRVYSPNKRLALKSGAIQVVVSVNGVFPTYDGWQKLIDRGKLLVVHFGLLDSLGYYNITGIPLIQAGDTSADYQAAAANALFGGLICRGMVPRDISRELAGGTTTVPGPVIRIQHTIPEAAGLTGSFLQNIDSIVQEAIANGAFPGCQVFVAIQDKVVCNHAYGSTAWENGIPVKASHLYDLASITKVASTTLAFMKMQETGKMRSTDPLGKFITHNGKHQSSGINKRENVSRTARTIFDVTMHELLIHKSGLPTSFPLNGYTGGLQGGRNLTASLFSETSIKDSADIPVAEGMFLYRRAFDTLWNRALAMVPNPTRKFLYGDANMVLLQQAIDSVNRIPISEFMKREFYEPLGLRHCTFNPLKSHPLAQIVPTALDLRWRRQLVQGTVHDPLAALFGGVAGNAGLFSNAHDLGVIGQMLLNGGTYGGVRFLDTATIKLFTTKQPGLNRGMGFDIPVAGHGIIALGSPATTYGHTGYTGTCLWIDPENGIVFAFVSNRIHPNAENQKINFFKVRERLHQAIYDELRLTGIPIIGHEE